MEKVVDEFHKLYYEIARLGWCTFENYEMATKWRGVAVSKCPFDLWQYQEIITDTKPDIIIETGTWCGGSALYLKDISKICGSEKALVVTIDRDPIGQFKDEEGVLQLVGDSVGDTIAGYVKNLVSPTDKVMVILDSDHSKKHVLQELELYAPLVTEGCYLVVEDTNVNGHPIMKEHGPGPLEALEEWWPSHPEFHCDLRCERFLLTFNPKGYYKRMGKV